MPVMAATGGLRPWAVAVPPLPEVTSGQMEPCSRNSCRFRPGGKGQTAPEWLSRSPPPEVAQSPQDKAVCQVGVQSQRLFLAPSGPCWIDSVPF